jgi:hypothetical protein
MLIKTTNHFKYTNQSKLDAQEQQGCLMKIGHIRNALPNEFAQISNVNKRVSHN